VAQTHCQASPPMMFRGSFRLVHLFLLVEGYRVGPIFLIGNISINNNNNNNNCDRRHVYAGVNIF
jgi:hypothetical protein